MNRKAQIGTTLTWLVGFIIIFFVIILFLSVTLIMSTTRSVSGNKEEIRLETYKSGDFEIQKIFLTLLNKKTEFNGQQIEIKEIIKNADLSKKAEIESLLNKEISGDLAGVGKCNYILIAEYGINSDEIYRNVQGMRGSQYVSDYVEKNTIKTSSISGSGYVDKYNEDLLAKGIVMTFFSNNQKIKIKFGLDCS